MQDSFIGFKHKIEQKFQELRNELKTEQQLLIASMQKVSTQLSKGMTDFINHQHRNSLRDFHNPLELKTEDAIRNAINEIRKDQTSPRRTDRLHEFI